jgi:hypothetical protein
VVLHWRALAHQYLAKKEQLDSAHQLKQELEEETARIRKSGVCTCLK